MKKFLFLALIILLSGCDSASKKEEIMFEYAQTYYTNHMVMTSADTISITKEMLIEAADEDGYDMSKLEGCSNSSKIIFEIENREIKNTEYNLECK